MNEQLTHLIGHNGYSVPFDATWRRQYIKKFLCTGCKRWTRSSSKEVEYVMDKDITRKQLPKYISETDVSGHYIVKKDFMDNVLSGSNFKTQVLTGNVFNAKGDCIETHLVFRCKKSGVLYGGNYWIEKGRKEFFCSVCGMPNFCPFKPPYQVCVKKGDRSEFIEAHGLWIQSNAVQRMYLRKIKQFKVEHGELVELRGEEFPDPMPS